MTIAHTWWTSSIPVLLTALCGCLPSAPSAAAPSPGAGAQAPAASSIAGGTTSTGASGVSGTSTSASTSTSVAASTSTSTSTPTTATSTERIVLADFESGVVPPELIFFENDTYNSGVYTWDIDPTQGANGSHSSLKFHVTWGAPYFYYDAQHVGGPHYLAQGKTVNRLSYWMKLPAGWGQASDDSRWTYYNMHIGWYLTNDPVLNETDNGHYYTMVTMVPNSDWVHCIVTDNYDWQRSQPVSSFDPGRSLHLLSFDSFFGRLNRFYITGAPNPGNYTFSHDGQPYDMWFDELELSYEPDLLAASPRKVTVPSGTAVNVDLTSTSDQSVSYDVTVTNLTGQGVVVRDETGAVVQSVAFGPRSTRRLSLEPTAAGISNVVLYPHGGPQSPNFQNHGLATSYRGSHDQPGAAVLVIGQ